MAIKIEEAFNDCFERLSLGESLDSCLRSYPEHAMELDLMLRTAFDVKRRVYPIQPRPEFKYWSRVRLQGVQDYMSRQATTEKASPFSFRRNLAISVAGLLVLVIASSGTAAASNDALPDQPLYGVKMAVEQAQLALAVSDVDKAEVYAGLAGKRAHEIEAMARQGKADYLISTSARMDYQLEQAETYISKYQAANTVSPAATTEALPAATTFEVPPAGTSTTDTTDQPVLTTPAPATLVKPAFIAADNKTGAVQPPIKRPLPTPRVTANVNRAKTVLNSSTAKSLATLQDALDKSPESARPAIIKAIERVKKANEWSQHNSNEDQEQDDNPEVIVPRPNTFPVKPLPDGVKPNRDNNDNFVPPDKPKFIPPLNKRVSPGTVIPGGINNQSLDLNPETETEETHVSVPGTQIQVPVIKNSANAVISPETHEGGGDSPTIKVYSK
jgi:hypothetical protein